MQSSNHFGREHLRFWLIFSNLQDDKLHERNWKQKSDLDLRKDYFRPPKCCIENDTAWIFPFENDHFRLPLKTTNKLIFPWRQFSPSKTSHWKQHSVNFSLRSDHFRPTPNHRDRGSQYHARVATVVGIEIQFVQIVVLGVAGFKRPNVSEWTRENVWERNIA